MTLSSPKVTETKPRRLPVSIIVTVGIWVLCTLAIFPLSQGTLPFQLKLFADKGTPFLGRILTFEGSLFVALALMGLAYLITIRRPVPDMAARAPAVAVARAETLGMVGYAIVAQVVGFFLGHAVSDYALSLHMPGTLYGLSGPYTPQAAIIWAIYNFVVYAVLPFAYFRWRGYLLAHGPTTAPWSIADLCAQLLWHGAAHYDFHLQHFVAALPEIDQLRSAHHYPGWTHLRGAACGDYWTNYSSLFNGLLSVIIVAIQYFGPGMVKSVLTLRTGNAWVHVWAYHAIAPHVLIDTPTVVENFHIH